MPSTSAWAVGTDGASGGEFCRARQLLRLFAPPGGPLVALESCLFAAGEEEVHDIVFLEDRAVWPSGILLKVSRRLVAIHQHDFIAGALHHVLGFQ